MFEKVVVEIQTMKSISDAWKVFTSPEYITQWNFASEDWYCPTAINDLVENGIFNYRMESKDKKYGFDFSGKYLRIIKNNEIEYELGDGRIVKIEFIQDNDKVLVRETFDAEKVNSIERQKTGWQSILDNYKTFLEKLN